jgi:hypothetical protein
MRCPAKGAFEAYAQGTLAEDEAIAIRRHAKSCSACRLRLSQVLANLNGAEVRGAAQTEPAPDRPKNRRVHFDDVERDETLPEWAPKRVRVSTSARTARMQRDGLLDGK